jgi:hypothetical protein
MKPYNIVLAAYLLSVLPVTAQPTLDFKQLPKGVRDHALEVREFNPDQPRHPARVSEGVQFARAGAAGKPAAKRKPAAKPSKPAAPAWTPPISAAPPAMSDAFRNRVNAAVGNRSPRVQKILDDAGVKTMMASSMTQVFPELGNQKLPGVGTPEGMTVDAMNAMYRWTGATGTNRTIGIAEYVKVGDQFQQVSDQYTEGAVHHETGHALDHAMGPGINGTVWTDLQDFIDVYNEDVAAMPKETRAALAYFLQTDTVGGAKPGSRGRSETFAELYAWISGGKGTYPYDLRTYFPKTTKGMETVVHEVLGQPRPSSTGLPTAAGTPSAAPAPTGPPLAGVPEGGQFGSGTGTTSKPPKDKPEEKPDDAKVAQQLTGAAIMKDTPERKQRSKKIEEVAKEMKWFFNLDRNDVVQLVCRIEGNNFIGDARREVKPGESFFGVSYASLRVAKFGTVEVDVKGNGTLHPAR